ncbi:MAG: light-harvesting protein [Labrys sp. (in: a-proteobacteria)]
MNNAKIWLVVKPTVGIPLFLGAVAVGSLYVHTQILLNTTWLPSFLEGKPVTKAAAVTTPDATVVGSNAVVLFNGAGQSSPDLAQQATVVLPDGRTAKVVFTPGEAVTVASAGQVIAK